MKKTISAILVCILLVGCIFTLASCGKTVNGTYKLSISDSNYETYEFGIFGNVTKSTTTGVAGYTKTEDVEGKYKINETGDNKYTITFTWDVDGEEEIETVDFATGTENNVDYVQIGILKYTKVK